MNIFGEDTIIIFKTGIFLSFAGIKKTMIARKAARPMQANSATGGGAKAQRNFLLTGRIPVINELLPRNLLKNK